MRGDIQAGRGNISTSSVGLCRVGCGKQTVVLEELVCSHPGFPWLSNPGAAPALWPVTPD